MKKYFSIKMMLLVVQTAVLMIVATVSMMAQDEPNKIFKVGDRVEVDPQAYGLNYKYKKWYKATVTKLGPSGGGVFGYYVRLDAEGGNGPANKYVMTDEEMTMIRPLNEAEAPAVPPGGANPGTVPELPKPAAIAGGGCQPNDDASGTSQTAIFKSLIMARYVHTPESEQDGTTTVTFQSLKIGAMHKWRPGVGGESPDGPGGMAGASVYPAKAVYTVCTDHPGYAPTGYRGTIDTRQDDNVFYCFKNQFGEWQCNLGEGTMGKTKSTDK